MFRTSGPDDRDGAVVTLAAAVIAVAGTSLGHASGRRDALLEAAPPARRYWHAVGVAGTLAAAALAGLLAHVLWPESWNASRSAVAALIAAVAGVVATLVANEYLLHSTTHVAIGVALFAVAVVWGGAAVLRAAEASTADSHVAYAAALVGVAGTMLGHATGRQLDPGLSRTGRRSGLGR